MITIYFKRRLKQHSLGPYMNMLHKAIIVIEVNALRLSFNMTFLDCASALFYSVIKLALDTPHNSPAELRASAALVIRKWKKLLKGYITSADEEIEVILKFEEMCLEYKELAPSFTQIIHLMYDEDLVQEGVDSKMG
ncbi:unnamed protein product [Rhodiola kirilowii]